MIHKLSGKLTLDTRTNKVIIETIDPYRRIVLNPGKKLAEHWADVIVDDRPYAAVSYAKDLCKILCQNLPSRKHVVKAAKEVTSG